MGILSPTLQALGDMVTWAGILFIHGGWIVFAILLIYILFKLYLDEIQGVWSRANPFIYLHIKVDRANLQSTLAVEQIFAQLHAIQTNYTFAEKYLEGKKDLWISLEIVSIGGKISYFVVTPSKFRHLVEAAFYARYPNAEIEEVQDYMKGLKDYDPDASWDIWGTELKYLKDYAYPLRTYPEFEHPAAEEKIIEPIAGLLEALAKMDAHELMGVQIIAKPIADKSWIPHVQEFAKKLKQDFLKETKASQDDEESGGNPILSGGERKVLEAIELKASKAAYAVKIRLLYIAPKNQFDSSKKTGIIGAFRNLTSGIINGLKPDVSVTWTNYNYRFFKDLEKPYTDYQVYNKKKKMLKGYHDRSAWIGAVPMIMNIEELATLYHFPLSTTSVPPVENVTVKKGSPPADLPTM